MQGFSHEDLSIEVTEGAAPAVVRLDWKGKSNAREPARVLRPFFDTVARHAGEQGSSVEMHFEAIDHFNSSTITALILLIQQLRATQTPLTLVFDPGLKWQKLSFDALKVFQKSDGLLTILEAH